MTLKRMIAAMLVILLLTLAAASAAGGTAGDPLATKSYVDGVFATLRGNISRLADGAKPTLEASAKKLDTLKSLPVATTADKLAARIDYAGYIAYLEDGYSLTAETPRVLTLKAGERVMVSLGTQLVLLTGSATLDGARAADIVNTSAGASAYVGLNAPRGAHYVLVSEHIAGFSASTDATVMVSGSYQVVPAFRPRHTADALTLQQKGLLRGSNLGLELGRKATRLEALIMFLRLIGEEKAALAYSGTSSFTDVPVWGDRSAEKYVAYAYAKGYTNGVTADKFGSYDTVTAEQYMTFVLRALGYSDKTDFEWHKSLDAAVRFGILTAKQKAEAERCGFYRDTMAYFSLLAVSQ